MYTTDQGVIEHAIHLPFSRSLFAKQSDLNLSQHGEKLHFVLWDIF